MPSVSEHEDEGFLAAVDFLPAVGSTEWRRLPLDVKLSHTAAIRKRRNELYVDVEGDEEGQLAKKLAKLDADEEDDDDAAVVETRLTAEHLMTLPPQLPLVKVVAEALAQHTIPALLTDICGQCYKHAKPVNKVECNDCGTVDCFRVTDGAGIVESSKKRKTMSYISDPVTPIARRDRRIGIGGGSISSSSYNGSIRSSSYNGSTDRIRRCRAAVVLDPDLETMAGRSMNSITPAISPTNYEDDGHLAQGYGHLAQGDEVLQI